MDVDGGVDARAGMRALVAIVAATILSTATHYAHNFLEIEDYPPADGISNATIQVAIAVSWPLLTAIGLAGVRLYARGRRTPAHAALLAYSVLGLATLGHFPYGIPDIPFVFFATIFTDALCGLALVAFVAWSAATSPRDGGDRRERPRRAPPDGAEARGASVRGRV